MSQLISELKERGLIAQISDEQELTNILSEGSITLYAGFDPTADSLHIGHLLPILLLRRFQLAGHKPIVLVGGGTGLIGDPSFKATERSLNTTETVSNWVQKLQFQLEPFLSFSGKNAAVMANNADWLLNMGLLSFLRDIGKHFSVNAMINKESVKLRLERDDVGISYTEFAYSLLQSYDFAQLNKNNQCVLQLGGSDQWGNITSGIDLTRRLNKQTVYGLTHPLVTKSDGTKFGKTEGGAVWLNSEKTSPYQFYQFWLKTSDTDVYNYLRYFTFLSIQEIDKIEQDDQQSGQKPEAQRILAEEMTRLIHGDEALVAAKRITQSLFSEDQSDLTEKDFEQLALDGLPHFQVSEELSIVQALVLSGLAKSNNESRGYISQGAVSINGKKINSSDLILNDDEKKFGKYMIIRRGKRNHALLIWS